MDNICQFEDRETIAHQAREWLVRLDGDEALTLTEKQALQEWLARSPAHRQELERIAEFWDNSNILTELSIPLHQVASSYHRSSTAAFFKSRWLTPRGGMAVAMSVLVIMVMLRGYLLPQPLDASNGIYAAAIGEIREQQLADGSILELNTDSQVQVDYSESTRKIRLLRGEAHFDVAHNPDWPFEVYAGKGRVKAVGTAFSVRLEQERLSVIVTDGKVDLAATRPKTTEPDNPNNQPTLTPPLETIGSLSQGQGASFRPTPDAKPQYILAQKEIQRQLSWREGYLVFEGEPLSVVVTELNRYLPMRVEIIDSSLSDLPIGGRFKVGELEALFDVLETSFDVQVSRLDEQHIKLFHKDNNKK